MNKSESKYFNTAVCMDKAFLELLEEKDFEYITVKEICQRAGVNRSTFYLHYETVGDLLEESVEYISRQFASYFSSERSFNTARITEADINELYLITPQYLKPYLQYVKDHRRLFKTILEKPNLFGTRNHFKIMFEQIFSPIMDRYRVSEEKKIFLLSFNIYGIVAVLKIWLRNDCHESIDFISNVILDCIIHPIK